jgi:hypothetical protein
MLKRADAGKCGCRKGRMPERADAGKGRCRVLSFFQSPDSKGDLRHENFLAEVHTFFTECFRALTVRGILDNRYV